MRDQTGTSEPFSFWPAVFTASSNRFFDFGGNRRINAHKFVVIFCLFHSLNADPRQGNAYKNSSKKVSVNYRRITFDLMPLILSSK